MLVEQINYKEAQRKVVRRGFTIVELLIVIAVIGILAAIVIVAYNGVQDNTKDAAVQADLRTIADNIEDFRLGSGTNSYPTATQADLQGIVKVNKSSYIVNSSSGSMSYCRNDTDFTILGRSASKNAFIFSSKTGLKSVAFSGSLNDPATGQCMIGGISPNDPGFSSIWLLKGTGDPSGYGWQSWIN
jgi:prepilin-type N-terminal cleavage/methylation domain-containing protein